VKSIVLVLPRARVTSHSGFAAICRSWAIGRGETQETSVAKTTAAIAIRDSLCMMPLRALLEDRDQAGDGNGVATTDRACNPDSRRRQLRSTRSGIAVSRSL
jgi:hypothetical protein